MSDTAIRLAVVLVAVATGLMAVFAERIPMRGGFGWDGVFYGEMAHDPRGRLMAGVDPYRLQRVAPSLLVYTLLKPSRLNGNPQVVLGAFAAFEVASVAGACALWGRTARRLRLGTPAFWLGVAGMFVSFPVLKFASYYPANTDLPALVLGVAAVWAYVADRPAVLAAVGLAGAFTWPVATLFCAILLAFPQRLGAVANPATLTSLGGVADRTWPAASAAAAVSAAVLATFVLDVFVRGQTMVGMGPTVPVYSPLAAVSVACTVVLVGWALYRVLEPFTPRVIAHTLRKLRWKDAAAALGILIGPAIVVRLIARGAPVLPASRFWHTIVLHGSGRPLVAPVSHVLYFGPVLLLLAALGRGYLGVLRAWGPGALLATAATVALALTSESRQLAFNVPLVVVPLCVAANAAGVRPALVAWTGVLAVALSRWWLVINTPEVQALTVWDDARQGPVYARYFMNFGQFASNRAYAVQVAVVAATAVLLWLVWRRTQRAPGPA